VSVQKESVIWKRGLLIIPDIVHQLLYAMQVCQYCQKLSLLFSTQKEACT
jgi:hypothetical protein